MYLFFRIHFLLTVIITFAISILANQSSLYAELKTNVYDYNYLFVHGLSGSPKNKNHYINYRVILPSYTCYAYSGPELENDRFVAKKVCLGQDGDIKKLETGLKNDAVSSEHKLIGVGVSKGAATLINAVATGRFPMIKALVLEGSFAHATDIAYHLGRISQYIPGGRTAIGLIMKHFVYPSYKLHGKQPITSAPSVPHIPILLIHSKQDHLIPINHSRKLYKALIQAGNKNVYLVEADRGEHAYILNSFDITQTTWLCRLIHLFYQRHNLPYDKSIVESSNIKIDLAQFQPSLKEINARIKRDEPGNFAYNICKSSKIALL
jgi:predicted esterase